MRPRLTEAQLSDHFGTALSSGRLRIHNQSIRNWVTELVARNGVADFVLTPTAIGGDRLERARRLARSITTPGAATVLAALSVKGETTLEEIRRRTSLSSTTVRTTLRKLTLGGVVWGEESGVRLLFPIHENDIELWAYELKLKDWKRGLYQAFQYKPFAHSVAIVLPREAATPVMARLDRFRAYNVGVLIFDPETDDLRVLVRPKKSPPDSLSHYLFALAGFVRKISAHQHGQTDGFARGGTIRQAGLRVEGQHIPSFIIHGHPEH